MLPLPQNSLSLLVNIGYYFFLHFSSGAATMPLRHITLHQYYYQTILPIHYYAICYAINNSLLPYHYEYNIITSLRHISRHYCHYATAGHIGLHTVVITLLR